MTITPLSRERHGAFRWRQPDNFNFASNRAVIPLVAAELRSAATAFPIAFTNQNEGVLPVALIGLSPGENLFVSESGAWRGRYVPAELRSYPFTLHRAQDGRQIVAVSEDGTCLSEGPQGTPLFAEDGKPSAALVQVLDFLGKLEQNRAATSAACKALQESGCIESWPLAVRSEQGERRIEGLFRVNEAALNGLSDNGLLAVRRAGALPIAYAQLLSMRQLPLLGELAAAQAQRPSQVQFGQDLDLSWLSGDILKLGSSATSTPSESANMTGDNS